MIDIGAVVAGRFRVLKKLGEGGMGAVFEVENTSNGRHFALKTVHPHLLLSRAALDRFEVEVRASVQVESDHVVNAVDTGVDEVTNTPWLLLELLQGHTLEDEVKTRGALAPLEAHWILEQLGAALVAAHTAHPNAVVHLDLKPSNVFLANTRTVSRARVVKVLDFGLARFIDASKTAADLTSQSGTLEWMAPEQFEVGQVRPATDVWAYGLIAFFVLTGRCFWKSANVSGSQYKSAAVLAEVMGKPIPNASVRVQELAVNLSLPPGFDAWLTRCLQREEGDRFKSAVECVPALLALLSKASASATPPPDPVSPRGATAVGAPSVPKDLAPVVLPPVKTPLPPSAPLGQRTELMRGGPSTPAPAPPHKKSLVVPTRALDKRLLALAAAPLLGLAMLGLTRSPATAPTPRSGTSTSSPTSSPTPSPTPSPASAARQPEPALSPPPAIPSQPTARSPAPVRAVRTSVVNANDPRIADAMRQRDWAAAESLLRGAIRQQPNSAQLHAQLGNVLGRAGNNTEAVSEYQTATRLAARNVGYLHRLADFQLATGDRPGAVATLQRILAIAPGDPAATRRLAALQR